MIENDRTDDPIRRMQSRNKDNYQQGLIPPAPQYENTLTGQIIGRHIITPWSKPAASVPTQELAEKLSASLRLSLTLGIISAEEFENLRAGSTSFSREQLDTIRPYVNILNAFYQEGDMLKETTNWLIVLCCDGNFTLEHVTAIFGQLIKDMSSINDRLDAAVAAGRIDEGRLREILAIPEAYERMVALLEIESE